MKSTLHYPLKHCIVSISLTFCHKQESAAPACPAMPSLCTYGSLAASYGVHVLKYVVISPLADLGFALAVHGRKWSIGAFAGPDLHD